MKRILLTIALVGVCVLVGWFAYQVVHRDKAEVRPEASCQQASACSLALPAAGKPVGGPETVVGMGRIEPVGGLSDIGAMMGDRLGRLLVEEGTQVEKGQPLADLESRPLRKLELEAATQQLQNAQGRLEVERQLADVKIDAAKLGVRKAEAAALTVDSQRKKLALLKVGLTLARKDQERLKGLSGDLVSDQERERQALVVEQAESEYASAQAMLEQLESNSQLGLEAARLELTAAQEAAKQLPLVIPIDSLRVGRELAETQYTRTQITAPCKGTILKINVRPGETLTGKPVFQMGDLSKMVVVAEVYENEIKYIRVGQQALVTSRALPVPYDQKGIVGKVTRIGQMINTPVLKAIDPFAPADRHVVEVRVELDEEGSRQAAPFSNLQVDVRFAKRD